MMNDIEHLRNEAKKWQVLASQGIQIERELRAEILRLRAALQKIIDEADSNDGLTAWDGSNIARAALRRNS